MDNVTCPFCLRNLEPIEVPNHKDECPTWDIEPAVVRDYVVQGGAEDKFAERAKQNPMSIAYRPPKVNEHNRVNDYVNELTDEPSYNAPVGRTNKNIAINAVLLVLVIIALTLFAVFI